MDEKNTVTLPRTAELQYLKHYAAKKASGFLYVRGRRRVGKSWLLREFVAQANRMAVFHFSGRPDETAKRASMQRFVREWCATTPEFTNLAHSCQTN